MRHFEAILQKVVKSMKLDLLKGKIVANGMNVEKLAESIGINRASLYRKLNNFDKITIGEAVKMKEVLSMTDKEATEIFLT
jgi:plasmid maintenance system antidote protein VapI